MSPSSTPSLENDLHQRHLLATGGETPAESKPRPGKPRARHLLRMADPINQIHIIFDAQLTAALDRIQFLTRQPALC